ncbi:MAG: DUF4405 domain-containing protein [Anaerolineales bacterium]|nr:DUF4405 domain-containing protein [Anaerolineales bacterium]
MANDVTTKTTPVQTKTKLWLDILIFAVFLIAMDPHSSGISIHEWLTLSMFGALTVHLLLSWDWITQVTKRFLKKSGVQTRINYILNWLLFIVGTLLMVSGIMISEIAIPSLGIQLPRNFAWRSLHDLSANLVLVLLGLHTALHWSWVVKTFERYIFQPIGRLFGAGKQKDVSA